MTRCLVLAALVAACRTYPPCPTLPTVTPPAQITVSPSRPPCLLPALPRPVVFGGVPDGDNLIVTKSGIAELAGYLLGLRAWISSASICLGPVTP